MFRKVLIANRGEAAVRIIRTCKVMGVQTVAVYSEVDAQSLHVKLADESHEVGAADPQESYSNISRILGVARRSDSDAIHPGYGYLAENPNFALACKKAGVKFVGPSPHTLSMTENKLECRRLAREGGVPTLPGTESIINDPEAGERFAEEVGYPVILKAAYGGGGRGIREVAAKSEFRELFKRANSEARSTFGKPGLFVEKLVKPARHIEIQFLSDGRGKVIHLGERECSIQRRHQKLVELTPCPALDDETRKKIGRHAITIAESIEAENAGTVEFLMDKDGNFHFIEVNARLQVEHPVTEAVTGIDIVEEQLLIAAGEGIPFSQGDVFHRGAAIECRINSEDPSAGFVPSVGTVTDLSLPSGPGMRVDTALYPGCRVTEHYDSLVAKVIAWDRNLEGARRRMVLALREFQIVGIRTTIPFQEALVTSEPLIRWDLSTDFVERYHLVGTGGEAGSGEKTNAEAVAIAAAVLMSDARRGNKPEAARRANWYEERVEDESRYSDAL
jgi:acetyl-CoA/propionyl-CoA carboxylase